LHWTPSYFGLGNYSIIGDRRGRRKYLFPIKSLGKIYSDTADARFRQETPAAPLPCKTLRCACD
jgi:hypothetical protein